MLTFLLLCTLGRTRSQILSDDDDGIFDGEWGALAPGKGPGRPADEIDFSPALGMEQREDAIGKYSNGSAGFNVGIVSDYFVELEYQDSDNVVVYRPTTENDDVSLTQAYANMRIRLRNTKYNDVRPGPKVYYIPKNAAILARTVKELNANGTQYVIRGGGHSYEANSLPSSEEAAVIDMAKFTSLSVSKSDIVGKDGIKYRELTFGTGLRLATIYLFLGMKKLALVAGTCPANGSSGYYMGGGAGPAMRKLGWGSDQIIRAKVVMPDGSFAVADSDDSAALAGQKVLPSDLLYALRGGGSGTAIVYEYTLRVYHAPKEISRCQVDFVTENRSQYQTFVNGWSNDWKIWQSNGDQYPFIRIYSRANTSSIVMDSWTRSSDELASYILESMSSARDIVAGEPSCESYDWLEFLYDTFASYYASYPEMQAALSNSNYTTAGLLAMDYIGWGYAGSDLDFISPPLSPFADFQAVAPTVNGPSSFTAQGILSSIAWDSDTAGKIWDDALSKGSRFYTYALGGTLDDDLRGAATDDSVGAAMDSLSHGILLTVTDVSTTNQVQVDLSTVVADILDSNTVSKQPSRYYNFLNCYNNTDPEILYDMYYGEDVSKKLIDIKSMSDPDGRLKTWCNI